MAFLHMALIVMLAAGTALASEPLRRIGNDSAAGMSEVVIVPNLTTWHTSRIVATPDINGKRSTGVDEQLRSILETLVAGTHSIEANLLDVARLNISLVNANDSATVREELEVHFSEGHRPVVTIVGSQMPEPDVLIAVDAFGVVKAPPRTVPDGLIRPRAICPPGPKVYISGKAAPGDLATATRDTLKQIDDSLQHLGLSKSDIVQLRAFVSNVSEIEAFHREVRTYFGDHSLPAVTFTQWISSGYPVEIEAVVQDTSGKPATEIEFITPPGETASPVFCRVVRVPAGPLIYTTGLTGDPGTDSAAQVSRIFERLQPILERSGSDLRHLAKATYFCADDASSTALNALRPTLYDPDRPPAASKAMVTHIGLPDRVISVDWIAVPTNSLQ